MNRKIANDTKLWKLLFFFMVLIMFAAGCYYDKGEFLYPGSKTDCSTVNAAFGNVKSIMASKCATSGCHNTASAAGAVVLETYDQVKAKSDRIKQRCIVEKTMPPGTPLSAAEIAILQCWINSGTPNN
jgi:uncharacterized membrane protein